MKVGSSSRQPAVREEPVFFNEGERCESNN
jgi:hypothetical protein